VLSRQSMLFLFFAATAATSALMLVPESGKQVEAQRPSDWHQTAHLQPFNIENLTVPSGEILPGGPGKDGIPALVDPHTSPTRSADFLGPEDRVVGVNIDGEARAYPIRMLNWHEVVNDELAGVPFAVIYCPLCDSVSVVDRRVDGNTYTFGVSGLLYNSNVLLYDRTDDALWSQIAMAAVSGPNAGKELRHMGFDLATFDRWKRDNPEGTVATFRTGHRRDYGRNPYEQYFRMDHVMFPVKNQDDRLPGRARVVGVKIGDMARAYPLAAVRDAPGQTLRDTLGDASLVLEAGDEPGTVSVLEAPPEAQVVHTFWFAWAAFHPDTEIFQHQGD
jgi:hypothetical protein